ncbi:MAG: hypothetical protein ABW136_03170 [Steroidobacteraceae bacterium]
MEDRIATTLASLALAVSLYGCGSTQTKPAPVAAPVAAATPSVDGKPEPLICRSERITGSRTQKIEKCLTASQIEAQRRGTQGLIRDIDRLTDGRPAADNPYNNVMTPR